MGLGILLRIKLDHLLGLGIKLNQSLTRTSQQRVNKIIQLEGSE